MDRDEALRLLTGGPEGVAEWNQRREAGEKIPDLRGADLAGVGLAGANLGGADLRRADLRGADLVSADLRGAHLRGAIIDDDTALDAPWHRVWEIVNEPTAGRDLRGADLHEADLTGADLTGADLTGADLSLVRLIRCKLDDAIFRVENP